MTEAEAEEHKGYVFVSYSRRDVAFAHYVAKHLAAIGIRCWVDVENIQPGDDWRVKLDAALGTATAVLFLTSRASLHSPNCLAEIATAEALGKPIVIGVLERVQLSQALASQPVVDLRSGEDTNWSMLGLAVTGGAHKAEFESVAGGDRAMAGRRWLPWSLISVAGVAFADWLMSAYAIWMDVEDGRNELAYDSTGRAHHAFGVWLLRGQVVLGLTFLWCLGQAYARILTRRTNAPTALGLLVLPTAFSASDPGAGLLVGCLLTLTATILVLSPDRAGAWLPSGGWGAATDPRSRAKATPSGARPGPMTTFEVAGSVADGPFTSMITRVLVAAGHAPVSSGAQWRLILLSNTTTDLPQSLAAQDHTTRDLFVLLYAARADVLSSAGASDHQWVDLRREQHNQLQALAITLRSRETGLAASQAEIFRPVDEVVLPQVLSLLVLMVSGVAVLLATSSAWCWARAGYYGVDGCRMEPHDSFGLIAAAVFVLLAALVRARLASFVTCATLLSVGGFLLVRAGFAALAGPLAVLLVAMWSVRYWFPRSRIPRSRRALFRTQTPTRAVASWIVACVRTFILVLCPVTSGLWGLY